MFNVELLKKFRLHEQFSFFLIFIFTLALFSNAALAQLEPFPTAAGDILLRIIGLPSDFVQTVPDFIFRFIVPFLALFAIVYGIFREIRIFAGQPRLQGAISFFMVFLTLSPSSFLFSPSLFFLFVSFVLQAGAVFAFLIFIFMFFVGGALMSVSFWYRRKGEALVQKTYHDRRNDLTRELNALEGALMNQRAALADAVARGDENRRRALEQLIARTRERLDDIERKLHELRQAYTTV